MDYADSPFEIKALDEAGHIEGLAAGFGNVDHGGDQILFGAFSKTLASRAGRPIPMLHSHDLARPIGAWKAWEERPTGLYLKGKMTLASRDAQEAHALAKDGAMTGLSVGWQPVGAPRVIDGVRVLPEVELFETSLVSVPMNDRARVATVKSIGSAQDIADLLRASGVSGRRAKAAAGAAWKSMHQQDDEASADAELAALFSQSAARLAQL
ncbi:conserved hypothetical protein [Sphingomonas sp. EC-HK361]|uniref:HK97 family phage prohead protease n=1 Tax=Sphingomonas sp. EC-HK361 TaxID=2038397 RepID=UPI00125159A2|nr:HK97 family phage prohead protease [Sphingomonas sp. EC-HK361]VVT16391.1 conserved hypothetical protein [Sphingomonas sp. EC-HK361]